MYEIGKRWRAIDMSSMPRKDRLYGQHYVRGQCSLTLGAKSIGKSTLALIEAIAMATGRNLLGTTPTGRFKWLYYDLFNPLEEIERRVVAICKAHGIDQTELEGWLFIQSDREMPLTLIQGAEGTLNEPVFQQLARNIQFIKIDGLTLDPVIFVSHSPSTTKVLRALCSRLSLLAQQSNIAIELVHLKLSESWARMFGEDWVTLDELIHAAHTVRELQPMEPNEAAQFSLQPHQDYFRGSTVVGECFREPGQDNGF